MKDACPYCGALVFPRAKVAAEIRRILAEAEQHAEAEPAGLRNAGKVGYLQGGLGGLLASLDGRNGCDACVEAAFQRAEEACK